jgi:hypothetical protein
MHVELKVSMSLQGTVNLAVVYVLSSAVVPYFGGCVGTVYWDGVTIYSLSMYWVVLYFYGGVGSVFWGWCHDLLIILVRVTWCCVFTAV